MLILLYTLIKSVCQFSKNIDSYNDDFFLICKKISFLRRSFIGQANAGRKQKIYMGKQKNYKWIPGNALIIWLKQHRKYILVSQLELDFMFLIKVNFKRLNQINIFSASIYWKVFAVQNDNVGY